MKLKILPDFQICISAPLNISKVINKPNLNQNTQPKLKREKT